LRDAGTDALEDGGSVFPALQHDSHAKGARDIVKLRPHDRTHNRARGVEFVVVVQDVDTRQAALVGGAQLGTRQVGCTSRHRKCIPIGPPFDDVGDVAIRTQGRGVHIS